MTDIFAIAASITINDRGATQFLETFGAKLLGIHGGMEKLQSQMKEVHRLAIGLGAAFVGFETFKGLLHLAEHGKELNHQQSMLLRNGIAYKDVIEETTKAYQRYTQAVPTATGPDFLRTANELVSVKGTLAGADQALVQSLKIEGLIGNATGKNAEGQGYDFWRAVEDKGVIQNKQATDTLLNAMAQATIATGGKITGSDFYTYGRRAGTAWMGDSIDALPLQIMEMQTLGAPGAGVSRRTFANMIEGGQKLTKAQVAAWNQIGMAGPHGISGRETEVGRPDEFIQKMIDSLSKHGIFGEEATKLWASHALNRKAADYFMTAYMGMTERDPETGKTRLEKERTNLGRAQGLDKAYDTMMGTDLTANLTALNKQWTSFMEAVGGPLAKAAIPVLQDLTSAVNKMAAFADKHQDFTRLAGEITAIAAGLVTLAGAVTAVKAALTLAGALKGGATAEVIVAGAVRTGGPGRSPTGPLRTYGGVAGLAYDIYNLPADINSDAAQANRAANQKTIADVGRVVRDALPWGSFLHFSDDPKASPAAAPSSLDKTPARPLSTEGNALHRWDEMPASSLKAAVEKVTKDLPAAVDKGLKPVGDAMKTGVESIPKQVQPAISSTFSTIGSQIAAAMRSIAGAAIGAMPNPAPGGISYRRPAGSAAPSSTPIVLHSHTHLDGKIVASNTTRYQADRGRFPTSVGQADTYGSWLPPGTPRLDAA